MKEMQTCEYQGVMNSRQTGKKSSGNIERERMEGSERIRREPESI